MRKVRHCRFIQTGGRCDKDSLCSSPTPSSGGVFHWERDKWKEKKRWCNSHSDRTIWMTVTPPFLFFIQMHPSQTTSPISHPVAFVTRCARLSLLHSSKTPLFSNILRSLQNSNIFSRKRQNSSQLWVWWVGVEVKDFAAAAAFMCSEKTYSHTPSMSSSVRLQTWLT